MSQPHFQKLRCPGGATNLTSHVSGHYPQLLSKTQSGAETVKETPEVKILDGTLMSLFGKNYGCNTERATNITDKIAPFIIKDLRPYRMVDSQEFRDLLQCMDSRYQVPSRKSFSEVIESSDYYPI